MKRLVIALQSLFSRKRLLGKRVFLRPAKRRDALKWQKLRMSSKSANWVKNSRKQVSNDSRYPTPQKLRSALSLGLVQPGSGGALPQRAADGSA